MNIKIAAICLYITLIYWLSLHYPSLHMMFFPTLGAFSLLFATRSLELKELGKISFGAILSSIIGTFMFYLDAGVFSLLANMLITIWLITKFKWNAPPILAVSFIPFFARTPELWTVPLSVCGSLLGLLLTLTLTLAVEKRMRSFSAFLLRRREWTKSE